MRPNQIAHMRMAIVALSMGATLTTTEVAIGEIGPQPQSGGGLVVVPTQDDIAVNAPPPETGPINDE